jgi:hypothetical protein
MRKEQEGESALDAENFRNQTILILVVAAL